APGYDHIGLGDNGQLPRGFGDGFHGAVLLFRFGERTSTRRISRGLSAGRCVFGGGEVWSSEMGSKDTTRAMRPQVFFQETATGFAVLGLSQLPVLLAPFTARSSVFQII
ncbi:MAG: hypothetical protein KAI38_08335, partial [Candidatus Latescibacteria bacterium]|nr:hypothetical protein [Candidatus Latescibacterota bacterium]